MKPTVDQGYPLQTRLVNAALGALGPVDLTARGLQARADRVAPDLAPDEVAEPLALLEADLADHPPTALGARVVQTAILGGLVTRRHLQRLPTAAPTRPLVIVGWYRSGTTLLQTALSRGVAGYSHVPLWRLVDPTGAASSRVKVALGTRVVQALSPEQRVVHPVRSGGPDECWMWLAAHLVVDGWAMHWTLPRYAAWLQRVDRGPAYVAWASAAAHLQASLGHRLVLKDPAHQLGLPALLRACPDALLVFTHRDPATCIASHGSLTALQHRAVYGVHDPERAGRVCLDAFLRYRSALIDFRGIHLDYADVTGDLNGSIDRLCAHFGLPRAGPVRPTRSQPHHYSLEQWGLTRAGVAAALEASDRAG